jgi:serine protease Do
MKVQRSAVLAGALAIAIAGAVAGLAARSDADAQASTSQSERRDRDRDERRQGLFIGGNADRQAFRLDGRGSQIGVMVSDVDDAAAPGVKVDDVERGSAAEKAGVKEGDVVVDFDGERVRSARQLTRLVQETPSGRTVKMTVRRGQSRETVDITPEASEFAWSAGIGPEIRAEIERSLPRLRDELRDLRELRELPDLRELPRSGAFNFRFDGIPALGGRARLGVQVDTLTDQLAEHFGVKEGGVLVSSVTADSPAAKAGMKAGDIITKINGTAVKDAGDLIREIADAPDDGAVTIDIVRDKKAQTLKATLERARSSRPARSARPA